MDGPVLDKCPRYNLYIGGFIALRRKQALQKCRITHIVSVLDWQFEKDSPLIQDYQHMHIPVDDVEDENILVWFPRSNAFIHEALKQSLQNTESTADFQPDNNHEVLPSERGPGVLIHCAMGKSRSATILIAYLLWESRQPRPPRPSSSAFSCKDSIQDTSQDPDMIQLPRQPLSVIEALTLLRRGRPIAEPNEGFMDQLYLYTDMGCPTTQQQLESHKLYRRWMNKRNVEESLRINRAPEMVDIIFEDEDDNNEEANSNTQVHSGSRQTQSDQHIEPAAPGISAPDGTSSKPRANSLANEAGGSGKETQIKCRKCRRLLAKSAFIIPHKPPPHRDPGSYSSSSEGNQQQQQPCAHIFLHPLSWMKEVLAQGQLDGRLTCPNPKCGANIGKFAWQGLRCSCGGWVTPGFGVARGRVDEIVISVNNNGNSDADGEKSNHKVIPIRGASGGMVGPLGSGGGGGALRFPPGMRKEHL